MRNNKIKFIIIKTLLLQFRHCGLSAILLKKDSRQAGMTSRNKKGMTLVEVLIAMVVLLLVFLALMQTALVSIDSNMKNALRDEAVSVAEKQMNEVRDLPFTSTTDSLTTASDAAAPVTTGCFGGAPCPANFPATGSVVKRNFRNITDFCFCTNKTVTTLATDTRQVNITVGWKWKGIDNPLYTISTVVMRQQ